MCPLDGRVVLHFYFHGKGPLQLSFFHVEHTVLLDLFSKSRFLMLCRVIKNKDGKSYHLMNTCHIAHYDLLYDYKHIYTNNDKMNTL